MRHFLRALLRLGAHVWALFFKGPELLRHEGPNLPPLKRPQWEPGGPLSRLPEWR
jgi:hypothetical protein